MYDHKSWMGQQSHMTGLSLSLSLSLSPLLATIEVKDNDKNVNLSFKGIKLKYND